MHQHRCFVTLGSCPRSSAHKCSQCGLANHDSNCWPRWGARANGICGCGTRRADHFTTWTTYTTVAPTETLRALVECLALTAVGLCSESTLAQFLQRVIGQEPLVLEEADPHHSATTQTVDGPRHHTINDIISATRIISSPRSRRVAHGLTTRNPLTDSCCSTSLSWHA